MVDEFLGMKYKLDKSDKFDEYLKAHGVGLIARKMVGSLTPVISLTKADDGTYTLRSSTTFKDVVHEFKLGEEFEQNTPDGRKVQTVITEEGNRLIEEQTGENATTIVREFSTEQVVMTMTVGDVVCTRIYQAVQ